MSTDTRQAGAGPPAPQGPEPRETGPAGLLTRALAMWPRALQHLGDALPEPDVETEPDGAEAPEAPPREQEVVQEAQTPRSERRRPVPPEREARDGRRAFALLQRALAMWPRGLQRVGDGRFPEPDADMEVQEDDAAAEAALLEGAEGSEEERRPGPPIPIFPRRPRSRGAEPREVPEWVGLTRAGRPRALTGEGPPAAVEQPYRDPRFGEVGGAALALGTAAARSLWNQVRDRGGRAALQNLRLVLLLLLTVTGFLVGMVVLPIALIVFAMSAGVSHGLNMTSPLNASIPGPPLQAGQLLCPVSGSVETQPFGPTDFAGEPAMFGFPRFHTGIDLAVPMGTPVRAAESGQVLSAAGQIDSLGLLVGYGNLVRVAAPGERVEYYAHLSEFAVSRGDIVQQGQLIGFVGSTGFSTGPHLHFEVRSAGTPIDPAPFLTRC